MDSHKNHAPTAIVNRNPLAIAVLLMNGILHHPSRLGQGQFAAVVPLSGIGVEIVDFSLILALRHIVGNVRHEIGSRFLAAMSFFLRLVAAGAYILLLASNIAFASAYSAATSKLGVSSGAMSLNPTYMMQSK